ncbi:MAG: M15 family metallopeptidase [Deltaproteobacteria bacterium]|nr:M15 family metallopeptidase [Deltaproteobacteria bacterium]
MRAPPFLTATAACLAGLSFLPLAAVSAPRAARNAGLVDAATVVKNLVVDLRYATADNFLKRAVYPAGARCLLRPETAKRLARAQRFLSAHRLRIKVWDCYRPLSVQREMWRLVPDERYVGNPAKGSNHNRGAAIDVTLVDESGHEVEMPTPHDEFSPRAHARARDLPVVAKKNRERLRRAMLRAGFRAITTEWWHFNAPDAARFPVL